MTTLFSRLECQTDFFDVRCLAAEACINLAKETSTASAETCEFTAWLANLERGKRGRTKPLAKTVFLGHVPLQCVPG